MPRDEMSESRLIYDSLRRVNDAFRGSRSGRLEGSGEPMNMSDEAQTRCIRLRVREQLEERLKKANQDLTTNRDA